LEGLLVARIVGAVWRLGRLLHVEVGIFEERRSPVGFGDNPSVGLAFIRDARSVDTFSKLARYETTIERGLYRALHELQRLQAARAGQPIPPPAVLDVEVSLSTHPHGEEA
jgi:hypothetical protein